MRLPPMLVLSTIPFMVTFAGAPSTDPAFGVSCGAGVAGEPGVVTLEAGPLAPATIRVQIAASRTSSNPKVSGVQDVAGSNSGSCSTDTRGPYTVYLNSAAAGALALTIDTPDTVLIRGVRHGREWTSVTIVPGSWTDARLTW